MIIAIVSCSLVTFAQQNGNRISVGAGILYERGLDATISMEHETKHHNAWEYFVNGYIKWEKCKICGHVTPESFWKSYRSFGIGTVYKPCVRRGKNNYGSLRIGASANTDTDHFLGGVHLGYEHSYVLRKGWQLYWQAKTDLMIDGKDLFRTGIVIGFKIPTN